MICSFCSQLNRNVRDNRFAVASTQTGLVLLGWYQFYTGYTLFVAKQHVADLEELPWHTRMQFLQDLALVSEAVRGAYRPRKMNIEILANRVPHLHAHLFPRHFDDPYPEMPIWHIDESIRQAPHTRPDEQRLYDLRITLQASLQRVFHETDHTSQLKLHLMHRLHLPVPSASCLDVMVGS